MYKYHFMNNQFLKKFEQLRKILYIVQAEEKNGSVSRISEKNLKTWNEKDGSPSVEEDKSAETAEDKDESPRTGEDTKTMFERKLELEISTVKDRMKNEFAREVEGLEVTIEGYSCDIFVTYK